MMYTAQLKKGLSLVETLVAITILLLAIVGPMTIASRSLQTAIFAREQTAAFYLAQEGIELTIQYREEEALAEITSSGDDDFWDWRPSECGGTNQSSNPSCSFDRFGNEEQCNSTNDCKLFKVGNSYRHDSSGEETPYRREIVIDISSTGIAEVTSTVSWENPLFVGETLSVEAETFLYNIYDGF